MLVPIPSKKEKKMKVKVSCHYFERVAPLIALAATNATQQAKPDRWGNSVKLINKEGDQEMVSENPHHFMAHYLSNVAWLKIVASVRGSVMTLYHRNFLEDPEGLNEWIVEFSGTRGSVCDFWLMRGAVRLTNRVHQYETSEPDWEWYEKRDRAIERLARDRVYTILYEAMSDGKISDEYRDVLNLKVRQLAEGSVWAAVESKFNDVDKWHRSTEEKMLETQERFDEAVRVILAHLGEESLV